MSEFRVTFCYTLLVDASDQDEAEDIAYGLFNEDGPTRAKDFGAIVEEVN
jgi:hypothetical protein